MKKLIISAAVIICSCAFTAAQAQDTTGRSQNKSGTMKKNKSQKKMKSNRRSTMDSTGTYGTMGNRRRDSM